jgi:hypothetical protein
VPPRSSEPRTLKVLLASPNDVPEERNAFARLIRDINDVLAFLASEKRLSIELVRYETHSYPDLGRPQEVINRQIPIDYDIFVGVMWRRCGTPTESASSGTIEEFRRACERRKSGHLPRIMFYFCEQPIPIPDIADLDQLTSVVKFRDELGKLGLTWTYPSHVEFSEHVRGGLLRAIRDILREESPAAQADDLPELAALVDNEAQAEMLRLAAEYEALRRQMPSSGARTSRMTAIFSEMKTKAAGVRALLQQFEKSRSPGVRLAAIAILQMFPSAAHLNWLAQRLDNPDVEKPFVGYQAAVALLEAARTLPSSECAALRAALTNARTLANKLPSDANRIQVLGIANKEANKRCSE